MPVRVLIVIFIFLLLNPINGLNAEIVGTEDGRLIRLNDDNTWELIETNTTGKVVLTIVGAENFLHEFKVEDDFEEKTTWQSFVECRLIMKLENKTKYKLAIPKDEQGIYVFSDQEGLEYENEQVYFNFGITSFQFEKKVINPGDKTLSVGGDYQGGGIVTSTGLVEDKPLNKEKREKVLKDFGCSSHKGNLSVTIIYSTGPKFPESAGFSASKIPLMFLGNSLGVLPLQEHIEWRFD